MSLIKFAIKSVRVDEKNRIKRVNIINKMDSTGDPTAINELPFIMAALSKISVIEKNNHFTYTFPFKLK